eukprot:1172217-Rhodomonas_salina.2
MTTKSESSKRIREACRTCGQVCSATCLRASYAMSGTYVLRASYAMSGAVTDLLRASYAMSSTDVASGTTRCHPQARGLHVRR